MKNLDVHRQVDGLTGGFPGQITPEASSVSPSADA
jgi:hypothetical protein